MSTTTEKLALFNNAISMFYHSAHPSISDSAPVNFTNGKNVTAKNEQDYKLFVTAAAEGYSSNLWATPKQIRDLNVGAVVSPDACRVPIEMHKKSPKGTEYVVSYDVVNLDCVSWPNGIPVQVGKRIMELVLHPKKSEVKLDIPAPTPIPARNVPIRETTIEVNTTEKPKVRRSNILTKDEKITVGPERRPNVVLELKEFGIHVEARTMAEAQLLLDSAVAAYKALRAA